MERQLVGLVRFGGWLIKMIQVNRDAAEASGTTVDNETKAVLIGDIFPQNCVAKCLIKAIGTDVITGGGILIERVGLVKRGTGDVEIIGGPAGLVDLYGARKDTGLSSADISASITGPNIIISCKGVNAKTIEWYVRLDADIARIGAVIGSMSR